MENKENNFIKYNRTYSMFTNKTNYINKSNILSDKKLKLFNNKINENIWNVLDIKNPSVSKNNLKNILNNKENNAVMSNYSVMKTIGFNFKDNLNIKHISNNHLLSYLDNILKVKSKSKSNKNKIKREKKSKIILKFDKHITNKKKRKIYKNNFSIDINKTKIYLEKIKEKVNIQIKKSNLI